MSDAELGIKLGHIGLGATINYLLRRDDTRAFLANLLAEGRDAPTQEEIAALNARGQAIHQELGDALAEQKQE